MMRARASVIDRYLQEELDLARQRGEQLDYWGFGGGFDARWYRLMPLLSEVVRNHYEVENSEILDLKNELLGESSFASSWDAVQQVPLAEANWHVDSQGRPVLVVLEGAWTRLGDERLKALLQAIQADVAGAHVIVDVPTTARGWGPRDLEGAGWVRAEETWLTRRRQLVAPTGVVICPGMEAVRVLRLWNQRQAPEH